MEELSASDQSWRMIQHRKIKANYPRWRIHYVTFNGCHNHKRAAIFLTLYHRIEKLGITSGLDCVSLGNQAGVDPYYIRAKIGQWVQWKYLLRKAGTNAAGRPVFTYTLAERGKHFVEVRMPQDIVIQIVKEIKANRTARWNRGSNA